MGRYVWYSNAPTAATGYGEQTKLVAERMVRDGHELAVAANFGLAGAAIDWNGVQLLPQGYDQYSNDILRSHYEAFSGGKPTTLIGLYDSWVMQTEPLKNIPLAWWTPIDHDPAPAQVLRLFRETDALPIAMSRFGEEKLREAGLPDVRYIPHAIDRSVHRPPKPGEASIREALRVPADGFLVVTTAANKGAWPPRKAFSEMFQAMGRFMADHPDVYWYLHTDPTASTNGLDLFVLAKAVGLTPDRVRFADRYAYTAGLIPPQVIAAIHGAADVMLLTSMGEGFGVPAVESMAAGTPVIASAATAQKELVEDVGWLVGGQPWYDHMHAAFFHMPSIDGIVDALTEAYAERGTQAATDRRQRALDRAEQYDADTVWDTMWRPLLAELDVRAQRHTLERVASERKATVNTAIRPAKRKKRAA